MLEALFTSAELLMSSIAGRQWSFVTLKSFFPTHGLWHPEVPETKTPRRFILLWLICTLSGCVGVEVPAGSENERSFTQRSAQPYREAYRIIAQQMRACYRAIGLFGNGYEVQADLDTAAKTGTVELYYVGLTGAEKPEESTFGRIVTISAAPNGSVITTKGTTPKYAYLTHKTIPMWLDGMVSCAPSSR
jgi:hypothetical protein